MRHQFARTRNRLTAILGGVLFCVAVIAPPAAAQDRWVATHTPAANTQATATKAAATGKIHIVDCLMATFVAGTSAPSAVQVNMILRDGVATSGTAIFSANLSLPATAGANAPPVILCPTSLVIKGTKGNAMTLEFTAAGGANTFETVTFLGHDSNQ